MFGKKFSPVDWKPALGAVCPQRTQLTSNMTTGSHWLLQTCYEQLKRKKTIRLAYYISLVLLFWWGSLAFNLTTQITCGFVYHVVKGKKTGAEVQSREGSGVGYSCPISTLRPQEHMQTIKNSLHKRNIFLLILNGPLPSCLQ